MTEPQDVISLEVELENLLSGNSKIKSFKQSYTINSHFIDRWKFNEYTYYSKTQLPISSRGLFIDSEKHEICIRGYDKFFSIDEVANTKVKALSETTKGPYTVSIKENGCIVFISGLADGTLLVCSKNNLYVPESEGGDSAKKFISKDHAKEGYLQLLRLFCNDTDRLKQLALDLYTSKLTAVLELCDDVFEEHVIAYDTEERAGLYLHGLNQNSIEFGTLSMEKVYDFAKKYGFKKVDYFEYATFDELMIFLHSGDSESTYKGKEIEGYVIRCFQKDSNNDFFFKFKFEEPYLLYRQLREVTNDYINTRERVHFFKKNKKITNMYLDFVIPQLLSDPKLCEDYAIHRKGIIKLRHDFFKQAGLLNQDTQTLNLKLLAELDEIVEELPINRETKYIVVPVSILGLGKTTFTSCLMDLYPKSISTVSSDLCQQRKNNIPVLISHSLQLLKDGYKMILFDRNNHLAIHRSLIIKELAEQKEKVFSHDVNIQVIALPFVDFETLTNKRIKALNNILLRGDEHPTIKADKLGVKGVSGILSRFVREFQQLNADEGFNLILRSILDNETMLAQVNSFFQSLDSHYGLENVLIEPVLDQSIVTKHVAAFTKSLQGRNLTKKLPKIVYFGVEIEPKKVEYLLKDIEYPRKFKLQGHYHVTVAFGKGKEQHEAFNRYISDFKEALENAPLGKVNNYFLPKCFQFKPQLLVYDDKAIAIQVSPVGDVSLGNRFPHITIAVDSVPPVYSNTLLEKYSNKGATDELKCIEFKDEFFLEGRLYAFLG